ncbi:MAG: AI-2E family transporter [Prolixibacteraceae bacterium]
MKNKAFKTILYGTMIIIGTYFLFLGLHKASPFLIPLSIAILLSMVMVPVDNKLGSIGISRGWSVLISDLILLAFCSAVVFIVGMQVNQIANDWPQYEKKLKPRIEQAMLKLSEKTGMSVDEIEQKMKRAQESGAKNVGSYLQKLTSFLGNFLLVFVYIFFFMYYRDKFKKSVLGFIPPENRGTAKKVLDEASKISQQYLFGRFILILVLMVLYGIGLTILGIKQAILISFIAALLSLIPYVGNLIGYGIALLMGALTSSGGMGTIMGVSVVFGIAQFVESYILEPFVVGQKVNLDPTLTIVGVVLLGIVWGLAGMVVAIPLLGIVKVISDHVPVLHPVGYTLGTEGTSTESNWSKKVGDWLKRIKNRKKRRS